MEFARMFLSDWMITKIIWNHHTVMPWLGYVMALFIAVLGPLWFIWALRRVGRALRQMGRKLFRRIQPTRPSMDQRGVGPSGARGGDAWVAVPPDFFANPDNNK